MPDEDLVTTEGVDEEGPKVPAEPDLVGPGGTAPAERPASPVPPVPGATGPGQELEEGEG